MSERDIELARVQKAIAKNNSKIKTANQNAVLATVNVENYESQIEYQTKLYNHIVDALKSQINRAIENAKLLDGKLEELLEEKESLHLELKAASHFGKEQCEYCNRYFTPQGIKRHRESCASRPESKIDKKHKEEVAEVKDGMDARQKALEDELAAIKKAKKAKPKIVKVIKPIKAGDTVIVDVGDSVIIKEPEPEEKEEPEE